MANHLRPQTVFVRETVSPYHAIFKCPALAGHFKSITDNLRLLNLPPDLSSLCRFRELLPVMDPTLNNPSRGELEATVENNLSEKGQFASPCKTRK